MALVVGCSDQAPEASPPTSVAGTAGELGAAAPATGEPIRIGVITDGKSPVSDTSIQTRVAEATAAYLNQHRSGIGGRPIELVECDALADPAVGTDCGNRMIEEDVVAVVVGTTAVNESVWLPLAAADVPVMFYGASGTALLGDETTFALSEPTFSLVSLPISLAEQAGADKVTSIVIDVPAALTTQTTVAPALFEAAGIEFELVTVPPGTADMTPQMQNVADGDPGVVFIVGNDSFCISAINGLRAAGFTGQLSGVSQCVTDATREAVPGEELEGMVIAAATPTGVDNPSTRLYEAVVDAYGEDIDTSVPEGMIMFTALAGFQTALEGISGDDVTHETVIETIKSMPEQELPGAGGMHFRCNGKAGATTPAVCVRGGLVTTLDAEGRPSTYEVLGSTPIED
ncbi:ABC transporter substrate-binding protein [Parafrankia sp. FMc6]|uniref:ABC transporter substrate-binding protein n=1 Tax=Parafrankia soli TaxID=2599596 RepID=UPI0034D41C11